MKNKNENFKKFEEFFLNTKPDEILTWNNGKAFIELDWMFSDLLERKYVKQAIANIMQRCNHNYLQNSKFKNDKKPSDLEGFLIIRKNGKIILRFVGADAYTILNVYDDENEEDYKKEKYNKILMSDLNKEILNVIKGENNLTESQAKLMLSGIEHAQDEAFGNLIEYYKYLIEEKEQSKIHKCNIKQREDENVKKHHPYVKPSIPYERKNEIIDFQKRKDILDKNHPSDTIYVTENTEDGQEVTSYTAYVYKNTLKQIDQEQDGYVFVCEPIDGDRATRVMYIDKEQINEFKKNKKQDILSLITKHYLEMSNNEFKSKDGCLTLSHTSCEAYEDRIKFYIDGSKGKSMTNLKDYQEKLRTLYKNGKICLPYYKSKTINDIGNISSKVHNIDRTAQVAINVNSRGEKNGK